MSQHAPPAVDPARPDREEPSAPRRGVRGDVLACLVAAGVGILLAVAPHVATYARAGNFDYLVDDDDVFYLGVTRMAYHWGLGVAADPFVGRWEGGRMLHTWAQFVPLAMFARAAGIPFLLQTMFWKVLGGAGLGAGLYFVFRRLFSSATRPVAWALACALICLGDAGYGDGRMLLGDVRLLRNALAGVYPGPAKGMGQYRVVTPMLNGPFLLLLVGALVPPRRGRRVGDAALAVTGLAACILLYFYLWTAAVVGLGLYVSAMLAVGVFAKTETWKALGRSQARLAAIALAGGLLLGGGQIVSNSRTFGDPELKPLLARTGRGTKIDRADPQRTANLPNAWLLGKLALGAAAIVVLRRREPDAAAGLGLVWCLGLAGYALANSAIVTGLEFENYHWTHVFSPMTEILVLASGGLIVDLSARRRTGLAVAWAVAVAAVAFAAAWRPIEASHAPLTVALNADLQAIRPLRPALAGLDPDVLLAGVRAAQVAYLSSPCGLLYHDIYTPMTLIPLEQAHERHALNSWLLGLDAEAYGKIATPAEPPSPFPLPETLPARIGADREATFRKLLDDPGLAERLLARYRVGYLLLPESAPAPARGGPWTRAATAGGFAIWSRQGAAGPPAR